MSSTNNEEDDNNEHDLSSDREDNDSPGDSESQSNPDLTTAQLNGRKRPRSAEHDSVRFQDCRAHFDFSTEHSTYDERVERAVNENEELLVQLDSPEASLMHPAHYDQEIFLPQTDHTSRDAVQDTQPSLQEDVDGQLGLPQPTMSGPFAADPFATVAHSGNQDALNVGTSTMPQFNVDVAVSSAWNIDDMNHGISPSASSDGFMSWVFNQDGGATGSATLGDAAFSSWYKPNVFGQIYPDTDPTTEIDMQFDNTLVPPITIGTSTEYVLAMHATHLSNWKRQKLLEILRKRFATGGSPGYHNRHHMQSIFDGAVDDERHVLSLPSLCRFFETYWDVFHDQFPILHKPTFLLDYVHDYLLLAVITVGASLLDRSKYGSDLIEKSAQLADFTAWNLRWLVFTDPDSCPPAKLWVLQTLAILEVYEKTNGTRALHERAHVHFAAALTLMRRGSALVEEVRTPPSRVGELTVEEQVGMPHDPGSPPLLETWWSQWIAREATRRAAFGAFLLDSMHAAMFGHSATMVIHEIQLPLPCDDTLWSAPTSSEVGRIEFSLYSNGIRPVTFLAGLERTLRCRRVRTNPFGRIVLMAGILSVSWHMRQQELHNKSLNRDNRGVAEGWKDRVVKALDWWKKEYDESLAYMHRSGIDTETTGLTKTHVQTSKSLASVLYHLGHIAVQVDMPDLCILAGAKTMLGRVITTSDREKVHTKLQSWAASSGARYAVYHSVRYICSTLRAEPGMRERSGSDQQSRNDSGFRGTQSRSMYAYDASNDHLLPRPWVLYFSTLVVWAYGYLLDGHLRPFPDFLHHVPQLSMHPTSIQQCGPAVPSSEHEHDAQAYLTAMSRFDTPQDLQNMTSGRNKVVGLIGVVSKVLEGSKWELLEEARDRLHGAREALRPP